MSAFLIKQLHTLDSFLFSYVDLNKAWGCDKRYGMDALQRFLFINQRALDFLNIKATIEVVGNNPNLRLTTSQYAGSIPTLSPRDGKPCGDICIGGRFGEDFSELLSVIDDTLLPTYDDSLPPLTSSLLEPPLYFECCNFIDQWLNVERAHWHKFDVIERIENSPSSGTRWDAYAQKSYDPDNLLCFPNRNNKLRPFHKEFCQMLAVLYLCFREIKKSQTPMRSRIAYSNKIARLQAKYRESLSIPYPHEFVIHMSDPLAVKEAKKLANIIVQNKRTNKRAWRIDYSEFFERYVQYLFISVSKNNMSKAICNPHYSIFGHRPTWALHYLEPDIVLQKDYVQYVIDAKYKSHMFNWNDTSTDLKDTFRRDLHQVLAYSAFNSMTTKKALLIYPFNDFTYHKMQITSPLTHSYADIFLVGIPMVKGKIDEVKDKLCEIVNFNS